MTVTNLSNGSIGISQDADGNSLHETWKRQRVLLKGSLMPKCGGERAKDKSQYLSQLHTDYYNKVGYKYGLARGFSYDELSEEEKRGRKHKNKVVLEAERQYTMALWHLL